jgi:hypothetical protein
VTGLGGAFAGGAAGSAGADVGGAGGQSAAAGAGGVGGAADEPQYLTCTDTECCIEQCSGSSICGVREFTGCTEAVCGGTGASPCTNDVITLPAWFEERECVLYWLEGGVEYYYFDAFAYCPCEQDGLILAEEVSFSRGEDFDGTCDFSDEPEPGCDVDFSECS